MQIFERKGLFVGGIGIDAGKGSGARTSIITHGHADHVSISQNTRYVLSKKTKALVEKRFNVNLSGSTALKFGEKINLNGSTLSLHNSGHILGASQALIEGSKAVAVTSDFKMQDSLIQKGAEALKCDILAIETTFGLPCYSFPKREQVYNEIGSWVQEKSKQGFVVLAGYSLGKAQELTAVCNEHAGIAPLVHESIFKNNKVYEKHGAKLGDFVELKHNLHESTVLIMPPSLVDHNLLQVLEFSLHKKVFSAIATGWQHRGSFSKTFSLSDHADFEQLMQYVQQAEPKLVLTMHGFEKEFASYVQRRLGIAAKPLGMHGQKTLTEFA